MRHIFYKRFFTLFFPIFFLFTCISVSDSQAMIQKYQELAARIKSRPPEPPLQHPPPHSPIVYPAHLQVANIGGAVADAWENAGFVNAYIGGGSAATAIGLIPGTQPVAGVIAAALLGANAILWWNTHKGTGFAVHVPKPGGFGVGRVPFLWDWDTGKAVY